MTNHDNARISVHIYFFSRYAGMYYLLTASDFTPAGAYYIKHNGCPKRVVAHNSQEFSRGPLYRPEQAAQGYP